MDSFDWFIDWFAFSAYSIVLASEDYSDIDINSQPQAIKCQSRFTCGLKEMRRSMSHDVVMAPRHLLEPKRIRNRDKILVRHTHQPKYN